jgi:hypothetical protein
MVVFWTTRVIPSPPHRNITCTMNYHPYDNDRYDNYRLWVASRCDSISGAARKSLRNGGFHGHFYRSSAPFRGLSTGASGRVCFNTKHCTESTIYCILISDLYHILEFGNGLVHMKSANTYHKSVPKKPLYNASFRPYNADCLPTRYGVLAHHDTTVRQSQDTVQPKLANNILPPRQVNSVLGENV